MANHRSRAQFDRAAWRLVVLGPAWILQLVLSLAILALFSWRLGDTAKHYGEKEKKGDTPTIEFVWEATNVGLAVLVAASTIFEVARYFAETLTPWTMLFTHILKLTCAIAILALDIVVYVQQADKDYSLVGVGLDCLLIVTAIALALYATLTYRRLSAYDDYAHPANVKSYGFRDGLERDNSYSSRTRLQPSLDKRLSSVSSRFSFSSAHSGPAPPAVVVPEEQSLQDVAATAASREPRRYSHERDTLFDEYLARRGSYQGKADVERAVGGEFGWASPSPPTGSSGSPPPEGPPAVTMGTVKSRPRGASMPRTPSYVSDRVLLAVPEEDDDAADKRGADREALLGDEDRKMSIEGPPVGMHEVDLAESHGRRE